MLRITRLTGDGGIPTIVVEGRLTEGTMNELASALDGTAPLRIDLSGVRFADAAGVGAIRGATRSGAELVGCSGFLAELLRRDATGDGDLVARLQAGDEAAFETLVRTHGGRMLAVARRFFPDEQDARDVVQEAFLAAFRSIASFDRRAQLSTWLHRIVVNAALMKLRTRRRRREEPIDDLLPSFHEDGRRAVDGPDWEPAADVLLQRRETRTRVRAELERLPDAYRTVLLLRDIEELDTDETATMLGITPQAVKTRLHRARQALRTLLERELA